MNVDFALHERQKYREYRNFQKADELRNELDSELVFVFDHPGNKTEVYYLTEKFFAYKPVEVSHRKYLENWIKKDITTEAVLQDFITRNLRKP